MNIAVSVNGQFGKATGVQQYVDGLLGGLYGLDTSHQITAFASALTSRRMLGGAAEQGLFGWCSLPNVRFDTAFSAFSAADFLGAGVGECLDKNFVRRIQGRTSAVRAIHASRRYDVMHIPEAHILDFVDYQPKHFVATIYDVTTLTCPGTHSAANIENWQRYFDFVKEKCSRVLTISEFSKRDIVEHLGIPEDRIDVTPLAARASAARISDTNILARVRVKFGLDGRSFVLYAGTLEPRKNLKRLISAYAQAVQDARLPDHRLVLAGGHWGTHDIELREHAEACGIGQQVIQTGYVSNEEMNALMSACEAFAYVSEYEGFGLPPLEAMVCGAPVVASNTTSLPEVVGDAGIQVDPLDVEAIAEALHLLMTDQGENERRRQLSLARAAEFSWERTARLTMDCYEAAAS
jgi:glycosyltransferase involved in cell wall biosynthesis